MNHKSSFRRACLVVRLVFVGTLAALGLLVVMVTTTPLTHWWAMKLAGPWDDPKGDVLIILGGAIQDGGFIGLNSYWRTIYAIQVFREGGYQHVVVSGGSSNPPISVVMRNFLVCYGIPASVVQVEVKSNSTRENALYTKQLLEGMPGKKILLTSDYQMFRAHRVFRKLGVEVLPRPFPDAGKQAQSWLGRWPAFITLSIETVKIGYYYAHGWI